jgi:hypothetical protein
MKDELSHSRTYKKIGDHTPSCEQEKRAVELAKTRLSNAQDKVDAVKHWSIATRRAVEEFQGPVQQLMGVLDGDIPKAIILLERMSAALERYTSTTAPTAIKWEDLVGKQAGASMSQPADETPVASIDSETAPADSAHELLADVDASETHAP